MNIIGRLTQDAEVRTVSQDKQVMNFSVAANQTLLWDIKPRSKKQDVG